MNCLGIDLVNPLDRMAPGFFGYLFNARVIEEGRIEGRPGYSSLISLTGSDTPNSIRRLNDPDMSTSPEGYTYIGGGGTNLYAGQETDYAVIDTGYSGNPLSLLTFRPDQSPESWMYVYDQNKLVKVRPDGQVRPIGVAPPSLPPTAEYGVPAMVTIADGDVGTWVPDGTNCVSAAAGGDRTFGASPFIDQVLYDSGNSGWCCINPAITSGSFYWAGDRMRVILNPGGPNQELVLVREINPAIASTTVQAIQYDSGSTGGCSIVLTGFPSGLARDSLIRIDAELIRVLAVVLSPDGLSYSVRAVTGATHSVGAPVTGFLSWYVYATQAHVANEPMSVDYVAMALTNAAAATGYATWNTSINASTANGRPIDPANDYFHISVFLQNPAVVTSVLVQIDTSDGTFTKNYWTWTIPSSELSQDGSSPGVNSWTDLSLALSSGVLTGDQSLGTFSTIAGLRLSFATTGSATVTNCGFDCWYFFGTYGPVIQPNSPVGYLYQTRYRDSSTGAHSVPGPQTRAYMFPLREEVLLTPQTSTAPGVDTIDIYELGGTVAQFLYVGSVGNNPTTPLTYAVTQPDIVVNEANQPPDLNAIQPWPILGIAWSGAVNTNGTSVTWVSGTKFDPNLLSATVILINGVAYQTFGQPSSPTTLQLFLSAGAQTNVPFLVASPTLAAQPLAFAFGPLEGPFAPVVFALGDPINGGTLYYANASDADSASTLNSLELTGPSEPLISGATWNGLVLCGSRDHIFIIRYSFLAVLGTPSNQTYQWQKVPAPSGIWTRWACCTTPAGMAYLGRDGIYVATDQSGVSISDAQLYPLFPHDGVIGEAVNSGGDVIPPVDMTQLDFLRLAYLDGRLAFNYLDVDGNSVELRYEFEKKRWFLNSYADQIWTQYLVEASVNNPTEPEILMLSRDWPKIYLAGGNTDNGTPINTVVLTPANDGGDERTQKLYVDSMTQCDGTGTLRLSAAYDNAQSFSPVVSFNVATYIQQSLQNLASLANLALYRNIAAKFAWTGGPDGPRLYAWECSGYVQPYLSQYLQTQYFGMSVPGWKSTRRLYPGLISNSDVLFTIACQDGRVYGPYTLPSTGGRFRIMPQMLDAGVKDLAFALTLDGQGQSFAAFLDEFHLEMKLWQEDTYIDLAVFRS